MIRFSRTNSTNPDFQSLVVLLDEDLIIRYPIIQAEYAPLNKIENLNTIVVAYQDEEPVGCGCFRHYDVSTAEVKRMFVKESKRGLGIASGILKELEKWAKELSYQFIVLETGSLQFEALALYRKSGYDDIET
ncbi:MAG: GNAT family N-acetyltransferase, partial [Flavisolibacter sp.]